MDGPLVISYEVTLLYLPCCQERLHHDDAHTFDYPATFNYSYLNHFPER